MSLVFSGLAGKEDKFETGYMTPAFSGAHKWAQWRCNPYLLGGPLKGNKMRNGYMLLAFSGPQKWVKKLCNPCLLRGQKPRGPKVARTATQPLRSWGCLDKGTKSQMAT